jgi:hypothetical protein
MMTSLVLLVCLVYAAQAQSQINSNLCEMEIEPGTFDNKLVLGGNYIETNSVKYTFATANDCMQGCCDQSHNPGENQRKYFRMVQIVLDLHITCSDK